MKHQNNVPPSIANKIGKNLYNITNHPIQIVKEKVFEYFSDLTKIEIENPYVLIEYNFDKLRVPKNHPSRKASDTFYVNDKEVLRTHMTCYLYPLGKSETGHSQLKYITCGDVYRKDAIDATHYPTFHQMDAFCIVDNNIDIKKDLRDRLSGLVKHLFGPDIKYNILEDHMHKDIYFPFTVDSFEIEVELKLDNGETKLLEILGAGTVHPEIMKDLGLPDHQAWAFGIGIDRIAMCLFDIPDIRLFWSSNPKFLNQFSSGQITKFKPFSKYEMCYKDVSFYINDKFSYNDLCSIVRDEDHNSIIESVVLLDKFDNKMKGTSHCYRITYRAMDSTLKNSEVNRVQDSIRKRVVKDLNVELR